MKCVIVLLVCALVAAASADSEHYTDRYDTVDLKQILANRRLLLPYIMCLLDENPCTAEGKELKGHIKEALEQDCAKCTNAQKNGTKQVIAHLVKNEGEFWKQLQAKYDPSGSYYKKHESELKSIA